MASVAATRRHDLTDAQWGVLEPLLPKGKKPGRPPTWSKRQLIDGIRWRTRVGSPWRDGPECYGPWQTVYGLFRRRQRNRTWQRIVVGLQARADADGLITWDVSVATTPQLTTVVGGIRVPRRGGGRPRTRPGRVLADKAYSSKANREYLRRRGIKATIPVKEDQAANRRKKGRRAVGRRPSTPTSTSSAMRWSAASTG